MAEEKFSQEHAKALIIALAGITAVIVVVILISNGMEMWAGLLEKLGLKDSKEDKDAQKAAEDAKTKTKKQTSANSWNPNNYNPWNYSREDGLLNTFLKELANKNKKSYGTVRMKDASAKAAAEMITKAVGYVYDTPENAIAGFKEAKNKVQVADILKAYANKYKEDAYAYLELHFDTTEQKKALTDIVDYVEGLPTGVIEVGTNKILY